MESRGKFSPEKFIVNQLLYQPALEMPAIPSSSSMKAILYCLIFRDKWHCPHVNVTVNGCNKPVGLVCWTCYWLNLGQEKKPMIFALSEPRYFCSCRPRRVPGYQLLCYTTASGTSYRWWKYANFCCQWCAQIHEIMHLILIIFCKFSTNFLQIMCNNL